MNGIRDEMNEMVDWTGELRDMMMKTATGTKQNFFE